MSPRLGKESVMKTNARQYFEKYYSKLRAEAILKSLLCGLIVGLAANFAAALGTWFAPFNGLWLSLGILVLATGIATPIFYVKKFRPTAMSNAKRIDRLGLEERLITMIEYQGDDSFIAEVQRADAKAKLAEVDAKQIRFSFSKGLIIALAVAFVLGGGMTTVSTLSAEGILFPTPEELINTIIPKEPDVYVAVSYEVSEGGYIEGIPDQLVLLGGTAESVEAVADDGYMFAFWDDGKKRPARQDSKVTEDIVYVAIFMPIGDGDGEGEGEPRPGDGQPGENGSPGPDGPPGQPGERGAPDPNGQPGQSNAGGGKYEEHNMIVDGETSYYDFLEGYQGEASEALTEGGDSYSSEQREIIERYFDDGL